MANNLTFELKSECPIEVVYGISSKELASIKSDNADTEGYGWCGVLDNRADQREEFLSGVDVDDAELIIYSEDGAISKYCFMPKDQCEGEEDLENIIQYDYTCFEQAGLDLSGKGIEYIVVVRLDLKFRSWRFTAAIDGEFSKEKVSVKIKNRDSDVEIASKIYFSWHSNYESSITNVYYDGKEIPFDIDFTSYAPEFLCLRKTSKGWVRDKKLEFFFKGAE